MPLWLAAAPLVLASRSAVRRALLEAAGVPVEICPADIDERGVEAGAPLQAPVAIAALLAREKASVIAERNRGRLILGADQTLSLDGRRFAKPVDRAAAQAQLRALSGRTHELYSAIAFVQDGTVLFEYVGVARLTMRAVKTCSSTIISTPSAMPRPRAWAVTNSKALEFSFLSASTATISPYWAYR